LIDQARYLAKPAHDSQKRTVATAALDLASQLDIGKRFCLVENDGSAMKAEEQRRLEDERWRQQQAVLRRAAADLAHRRTESTAATITDGKHIGQDDSFDPFVSSLNDPSPEVRNVAVRAFYDLNPDLAASFFNNALLHGSPKERRNIGAALVGSGLADHAIDALTGDSKEYSYSALSLLFLVAKAGEVEPLMRVIEEHPSIQLRLALIKLLALSGESKVVNAFYALAQRSSLPGEIRYAVREAIFQISHGTR
jgi:HEAT repeat protein